MCKLVHIDNCCALLKMSHHLKIYDQIKSLLISQLGEEIEEYEDGMYLSIGDSGLWISADEREMTIGYGFPHTHYDPKYDSIPDAVNEFFGLLTKRKQITEYFKGTKMFKYKIEYEKNDGNFATIGTTSTWLYPYWKKTTSRIRYEEPMIPEGKIEQEINKIKNYAQQSV